MVRICALSVPRFYDGGIEVGIGWSEMPAELTEEQRTVLLDRVGTLIQIHPDDVGNVGEYGFMLVGGRLREADAEVEATGEADVTDAEGGAPKAKRTRKQNKGASGAGKE